MDEDTFGTVSCLKHRDSSLSQILKDLGEKVRFALGKYNKMVTQSLTERLVFTTDTGESTLPPECALLVLTSTLATPITFVIHHFLQELLKSPKNEGAVFLSFLNGGGQLASNMKKLVTAIHTYDLCGRELMWFKL